MFEAFLHHRHAVHLSTAASGLDASGDRAGALGRIRQAVLHHAEAARLVEQTDAQAPVSWRQAHAEDCMRCGVWLTEADAHSEAAGLYQESVDLYGSLTGAEAGHRAHEAAQRLLSSIAALRARPNERIYLLTARYERQRQQLALRDGTEADQAKCMAHIGAVFLRRDRPSEAVEQYRIALRLYEQAPPSVDVSLGRAECHHRLGGLLARASDDRVEAANHYRRAIALYTEYEPLSYGRQQARDLCAHALRELDDRSRLTEQPPD